MIQELLLRLAGADEDVLEGCPRERKKLAAMGGTVATTTALAFLAATFTLHDFLHVPVLLAIPFACGWALAILNLDRWLLISVRRQSSSLQTVMLAVPRVALALVAGYLIAEPLVLRAFASEIRAQVVIDRKDALAAGRRDLARQYADIAELERQRTAARVARDDVQAGAALERSAAYVDAREQVEQLRTRAAEYGQAAVCELDGSCGAGPGSASYATKRDAARGVRRQLHTEQRRLATLRRDLIQRERTATQREQRAQQEEIDQLNDRIDQRTAERDEADADLVTAYTQEVGLLDRVEALGQLTHEHPYMRLMRYMLLLFVLLVDSLPAMAKVLMSLGVPSLYERVQRSREEAEASDAEMEAAAQVKASEIHASVIVDDAQTHKAFVRKVQESLVEMAVERMRAIGERFIRLWHAEVDALVPDLVEQELRSSGLKRGGGGTGGGPANGNGNGTNGNGRNGQHP